MPHIRGIRLRLPVLCPLLFANSRVLYCVNHQLRQKVLSLGQRSQTSKAPACQWAPFSDWREAMRVLLAHSIIAQPPLFCQAPSRPDH